MDGRERAVVAGVERGQQVERLGAAHLADHDPVGPHPQRVAQQVADRHLAPALDARPAGSRAGPRAAAAGAARPRPRSSPPAPPGAMKLERALSSVVLPEPVPPLTRTLRRARHRLLPAGRAGSGVRVPERDQLVGPGPGGAEAADRERRAVDRQRRDHDVDARAVGEAGVDHRAELVDPPAERREDPLDRVAQLLLVGEARRRSPRSGRRARRRRASGPLTITSSTARVGEQLLERPEADGVAEDQLAGPRSRRPPRAPPRPRRPARHGRLELLVRSRRPAAASARRRSTRRRRRSAASDSA